MEIKEANRLSMIYLHPEQDDVALQETKPVLPPEVPDSYNNYTRDTIIIMSELTDIVRALSMRKMNKHLKNATLEKNAQIQASGVKNIEEERSALKSKKVGETTAYNELANLTEKIRSMAEQSRNSAKFSPSPLLPNRQSLGLRSPNSKQQFDEHNHTSTKYSTAPIKGNNLKTDRISVARSFVPTSANMNSGAGEETPKLASRVTWSTNEKVSQDPVASTFPNRPHTVSASPGSFSVRNPYASISMFESARATYRHRFTSTRVDLTGRTEDLCRLCSKDFKFIEKRVVCKGNSKLVLIFTL
jgi:hypothetical protein